MEHGKEAIKSVNFAADFMSNVPRMWGQVEPGKTKVGGQTETPVGGLCRHIMIRDHRCTGQRPPGRSTPSRHPACPHCRCETCVASEIPRRRCCADLCAIRFPLPFCDCSYSRRIPIKVSRYLWASHRWSVSQATDPK